MADGCGDRAETLLGPAVPGSTAIKAFAALGKTMLQRCKDVMQKASFHFGKVKDNFTFQFWGQGCFRELSLLEPLDWMTATWLQQ